MSNTNNSLTLIELKTKIVSSHVANNNVTAESLPAFIKNVHASLSATSAAQDNHSNKPPTPAVPIKRSVSDDYLICLEDGKN